MAQNNYAQIRLTLTAERNSHEGCSAVYWRLMAKAPGEVWTERSTEAQGAERCTLIPYPPSREDMVAAAVEILLALDWRGPAQ